MLPAIANGVNLLFSMDQFRRISRFLLFFCESGDMQTAMPPYSGAFSIQWEELHVVQERQRREPPFVRMLPHTYAKTCRKAHAMFSVFKCCRIAS